MKIINELDKGWLNHKLLSIKGKKLWLHTPPASPFSQTQSQWGKKVKIWHKNVFFSDKSFYFTLSSQKRYPNKVLTQRNHQIYYLIYFTCSKTQKYIKYSKCWNLGDCGSIYTIRFGTKRIVDIIVLTAKELPVMQTKSFRSYRKSSASLIIFCFILCVQYLLTNP